MRRPVIVGLLVAALIIAAAVAWTAAGRDDEYRRLIASGDAALEHDQPFLALEAFSGAIALNRDSMLGYLRRGETYRRMGDRNAALRDLRRAAALDPTAPRPLERLGDVLYEDQRYGPAADRYAAYIRLDDRSARVLYKLAMARYLGNNAREAISPLREAIHLNDRFVEAYYLLGVALAAERQTNEAIWALRRAIDLEPRLTAAREVLAGIYRGLNRHTERLDQLETLVELDAGRADRIVSLASAQMEVGRTDLAVMTLGRALEHGRSEPTIYAALATMWLQLAERGEEGALAKALEASKRLIAVADPDGTALSLRGRALLLAGDTDAALRTLRDATTHLPVPPVTFERLATAAERAGNRAEARDALIRYVALLDDDRRESEVMARIADLSWRLRDMPTAVTWQQRATEHAPRDPALLARLASMQWTSGARDDARATALKLQALGEQPPPFSASTRTGRDRRGAATRR